MRILDIKFQYPKMIHMIEATMVLREEASEITMKVEEEEVVKEDSEVGVTSETVTETATVVVGIRQRQARRLAGLGRMPARLRLPLPGQSSVNPEQPALELRTGTQE